MKNMKIRAKLFSGFAIVLVFGIALGIVGVVSSHTLTGMAADLESLEATGTGISGVLNAHYIWRQGITEAALNATEFTGSLDPGGCALGKWLAGEEAQGITDTEVLSLMAQIEEPHTFIHTKAKDVLQNIEAGDIDTARAILSDEILPRTQAVITGLTAMQERYTVLAEEQSRKIVDMGNLMSVVIVVLIAVTIAASVLLTLYISGLISRPLGTVTAFMKRAGDTGDITVTPEDKEQLSRIAAIRDEIGELGGSAVGLFGHLNEIADEFHRIADGDLTVDIKCLSDKDTMGFTLQTVEDNLNNMFREIETASGQVSTGAHHIADASQALAQGSTEQAATVQQLSAAVSDIAGKTKTNEKRVAHAAELSACIKNSAEKGAGQMESMMSAMSEINQASQDISRVMRVIDDIAFQTNILALNAAVEAARAGQHGKGFAVVAEEVRNLAAKSGEAAKETGVLVASAIEKAEFGSRIAADTEASLAEIVSGIAESSRIAADVASSSSEQSVNIIEINNGIEQVAQVVQQNSATAEQSAASSEELSGQSVLLQQLIGHFKLRPGI